MIEFAFIQQQKKKTLPPMELIAKSYYYVDVTKIKK